MDQTKLYGAVPPAGDKLIEPVNPPLHKTFTLVDVNVKGAVGCVIITVVVAAQLPAFPLASVTVTVYVPTEIEDKSWVVAPLLHK